MRHRRAEEPLVAVRVFPDVVAAAPVRQAALRGHEEASRLAPPTTRSQLADTAVAGGIFYYTQSRGAGSPATGTTGGGGPAPTGQTEITFLYSTEKKEWVEYCATQFRQNEPGIKLTLQPQGSLDSAQAVADDTHVAAVFARECFTYNPDEPSFDLLKVLGVISAGLHAF